MKRSVLILTSIVALAGCQQAVGGTVRQPSGQSIAIDWNTNAILYRGQNGQVLSLLCPGGGSPGSVWGTDVYSDDSSICTAAVHAGRIGFGGGAVMIQITGPRSSFQPSTRYSVTSGSWGEWPGSFIFVGSN